MRISDWSSDVCSSDLRISLAMGAKALDVRVSTLPARGGERVVLRILDKDQGVLELGQLAMPERVLAALRRALHVPNGIVLVTVPTGAGKTTTLYAGLAALPDGSRPILPVQDPADYAVHGVRPTQLNTKPRLHLAPGLRPLHPPD